MLPNNTANLCNLISQSSSLPSLSIRVYARFILTLKLDPSGPVIPVSRPWVPSHCVWRSKYTVCYVATVRRKVLQFSQNWKYTTRTSVLKWFTEIRAKLVMSVQNDLCIYCCVSYVWCLKQGHAGVHTEGHRSPPVEYRWSGALVGCDGV